MSSLYILCRFIDTLSNMAHKIFNIEQSIRDFSSRRHDANVKAKYPFHAPTRTYMLPDTSTVSGGGGGGGGWDGGGGGHTQWGQTTKDWAVR